MAITKTAMTLSSLAVALLFGGGVFVLMNLSSIAHQMSERIASKTLGVPVTIASMDISLQEQRALVTGLKVANPDGFSGNHAVAIDTVEIKLGSVSRELIVFEDIKVEGTDVNLEVRESGTNLSAIRNNMTIKPSEQREGATEVQGKQSDVKVIIDRMAMTDAKINPSVTLFEAENLGTITTPPIYLTDIGRKENGVLAREAVAQVWVGVSKSLNKAANKAGLLQGVSPDAIKDMGLGQVQQFKDQMNEGIDNLKKDIKGLLGN